MVIDFAKVDVKEPPMLILQNLDDKPKGVLGYAFNVVADLCYNEISTLTFNLPAIVEGLWTPHYQRVVGMRLIDLKNYGRFILLDPKISDSGLMEMKTCTAYSLEYEFTFKKMVLSEGTYNFWNPFAQSGTILGLILDYMPSWKIGDVDASLIDKYRTFDDSSDQNIYNFMKSELQEAYGCIFYFDTYKRLIHVRDIMTEAPVAPVYFSTDNLIKKVDINEDTESIVTCLNVNGADGVDIRSVNPMGTNYLINLDYFMNLENFSQDMIDKYRNWHDTFISYQPQYYNLTVEEALKTAQLVTEQAALATLQGELTSIENIQATTIQAIAQKIKTQSDLDAINVQIASKNAEISIKKNDIDYVQSEVDALNDQMVEINRRTRIKGFFTDSEYKIIDRYLKEDSIAEESFVVSTADTYDTAGESFKLSGSIFNITNSAVTKVVNQFSKDIYSMVGGTIACSTDGFTLNAELIRASLDFDEDRNFLFTARLNSGMFKDDTFPNACISIVGTASSVTSDVVPDEEVNGAFLQGSTLSFRLDTSRLYFTRGTTEYEQRSVEWDLFEYGQGLLKKVAYPSYACTLDIVNFLAMEECEPFKNKLELGNKLYWKQRDGTVMKPILVNVKIPFDDLNKFKVAISSKYNSSDAEFYYEDLISEGINAGRTLDSKKWTYSQFVSSGAVTSLSKFTKSAMDISRNNIIASSGQAISWDEAGFRLRKRKDGVPNEFEPYQIWMNNSSIMFTKDNWSTANLAIGQIMSDSGALSSGVIADALIGKILAGDSLVIESEKKDGGVSAFRVDGSGASLYNAIFDIYNGGNTHITLNPYTGIAIGKYPVYSGDAYTINESNANFWVDLSGNVHLKGTLHGVDGTFSGELQAATGKFKGIVQASEFQDLVGNSMLTSDYKFDPDYLELKGLTIKNGDTPTFTVDSNGNVSMRGNITMTGGNITWANVNRDPTIATAQNRANSAYNYAEDAYYNAESAYSKAVLAENNVTRLANGEYVGTFINGKVIVSPKILTNMLTITTPSGNTSKSGLLLEGYWGNQLKGMLEISYFEGGAAYVNFSSPASAEAFWGFGSTLFPNNVSFHGNTTFGGKVNFNTTDVTGIVARFA